MKKLFLFVLAALVGISLVLPAKADESRTIPLKSGGVASAPTIVLAHGATVYRISGYAASANAVYSVHDNNSLGNNTVSNVMAEGAEASQYDSFPTIDFGEEGINFATGIVVWTTTANVVVQYR